MGGVWCDNTDELLHGGHVCLHNILVRFNVLDQLTHSPQLIPCLPGSKMVQTPPIFLIIRVRPTVELILVSGKEVDAPPIHEPILPLAYKVLPGGRGKVHTPPIVAVIEELPFVIIAVRVNPVALAVLFVADELAVVRTPGFELEPLSR